MFEEVRARFDEMIERHYPSKTAESAALLGAIGAAARAENRAAAAQLVAVGELFGYPGVSIFGCSPRSCTARI